MMKTSLPFLLCILLGFALAANAAEPQAQFQAGAATSNITPPLGLTIVGGFSPFPSKHVHDQLHARCLVLDDGDTRLALVVCDLLGLHRIVSDEARRLIQEKTGIPRENVTVSGTHTHSASSALGSRFAHPKEPDEYQKFVAQRIADGVQCAVNNLRPAEIAFGTAQAPEHVNNRRWHMKPGTAPVNPFGTVDMVKMNPPGGSPNLVEPAGPTDPTISFIAVREPGGKPVSVFTAYSLHYVGGVGPAHISADYFAMYCEHLKRLLDAEHQDPPFVALMANGTSGDINNVNFRQPRPRKAAYEQMRFVAEDVAAKVHAALQKLEYKSDITLDARYHELPVKSRRPTEEQLAWAKETLATKKKVEGKTDLSISYAERTQAILEQPEIMPMPVQALRIGDVCIASMPCEIFCEIGLEFKERSPLQPAFMISLNHGYYGYLPTPRHFRLGGYETWIGTNRLEPEASTKMMDKLLEMVGDLKAKRK
jgi:hypothetical protein